MWLTKLVRMSCLGCGFLLRMVSPEQLSVGFYAAVPCEPGADSPQVITSRLQRLDKLFSDCGPQDSPPSMELEEEDDEGRPSWLTRKLYEAVGHTERGT